MNILGKRGPLNGESFSGGDITDVGEISTGIGVVDDFIHLLPTTNGDITVPTAGVNLFAEADQHTYTYRNSKKRRLAEMTIEGALDMETFGATPAPADVGTLSLYADTSNNLNFINSDGVVSTVVTGETVVKTGDDNTFVGIDVAANSTSSIGNTGVGKMSLEAVTSGQYNTALGTSCMKSLTTGSVNVGVGYGCLQNFQSGNLNACLGYQSGTDLVSGSQNVVIGAGSTAGSTTASNRIVIGANASGTAEF